MLVIKGICSAKAFVKNPSAKAFRQDDGRFVIEIPTEGLAIVGSKSLEKVFALYGTPVASIDVHALGIGDAVARKLIHCRAVVPHEIAKIMARGTTSHARDFSSTQKSDLHDLSTPFVLIGSAVDFAQVGLYSSYRGPDAIREHLGKLDALTDLGNVAWIPSEGLLEYGKRLGYIVSLAHDRGSLPVILGGDHSLSYFTVSELSRAGKRIGVVHFDAHSDLGESTGARDAQELTHANVAGYLRRLPLQFMLQAGLRTSQIGASSTEGDCRLYQVSDVDLASFDTVLSDALLENPVDGLYVSIDMDCINPEEAPEVTTPLPGSMSFIDLKRCLERVLKAAPIVGADLVEVTSPRERSCAAAMAAEIVKILMGSRS